MLIYFCLVCYCLVSGLFCLEALFVLGCLRCLCVGDLLFVFFLFGFGYVD